MALETASKTVLWNCSKELRGEPEYTCVFAKKTNKQKKHEVDHQKIIASHKTQAPQTNHFSAFLSMGSECELTEIIRCAC